MLACTSGSEPSRLAVAQLAVSAIDSGGLLNALPNWRYIDTYGFSFQRISSNILNLCQASLFDPFHTRKRLADQPAARGTRTKSCVSCPIGVLSRGQHTANHLAQVLELGCRPSRPTDA